MGVEADSRLDQPRRVALTDDAWEALGAAIGERHTPAAVQGSELRVLRGNSKVAPARKLHPSRKTEPVDRGNRRLARIQAGEAHGPCPVGVPVPDEVIDSLEVGPRAKGSVTGARDYEHASRRIAGKGFDGFRESDSHLGIDAVVHLGAVECDDGHWAPPFDQQLRQGGFFHRTNCRLPPRSGHSTPRRSTYGVGSPVRGNGSSPAVALSR